MHHSVKLFWPILLGGQMFAIMGHIDWQLQGKKVLGNNGAWWQVISSLLHAVALGRSAYFQFVWR